MIGLGNDRHAQERRKTYMSPERLPFTLGKKQTRRLTTSGASLVLCRGRFAKKTIFYDTTPLGVLHYDTTPLGVLRYDTTPRGAAVCDT